MKNFPRIVFLFCIGGGIFLLRGAILSNSQDIIEKGPMGLNERIGSKSLLMPLDSKKREEFKQVLQEGKKQTAPEIEAVLKESNAIERLNADQVGPEERQRIKKHLESLAILRGEDIEKQLVGIQKELVRLEEQHEERLKSFGVRE